MKIKEVMCLYIVSLFIINTVIATIILFVTGRFDVFRGMINDVLTILNTLCTLYIIVITSQKRGDE